MPTKKGQYPRVPPLSQLTGGVTVILTVPDDEAPPESVTLNVNEVVPVKPVGGV